MTLRKSRRLYLIPVLSKALDILELLQAENQPMTLEGIHRQTKISKTTVYRVLKTYVHRGYLVQSPDGLYRQVSRPKKIRFGFGGQSVDMPFSAVTTKGCFSSKCLARPPVAPPSLRPVGIPILPGSGRRAGRRPALVLPRRFVGLGHGSSYCGAGKSLTRREAHLERQGPGAAESDTATIRQSGLCRYPVHKKNLFLVFSSCQFFVLNHSRRGTE